VDATVRQIRQLAEAGCDIVRVAVPDKRDTDALRAILEQSPVPIVADVHFHFQRALEAVEAGVHKIRLNPGNIKDRKQVDRVIAACRERRIPIRVGVNEGSVVERPFRRDTGTMATPHWRRGGSGRSPIWGMQERNVA
jgi:(E)-4-hydroxy-3-methylbut-2-enyl-diphosphate synthase